MLNRFRKFVMIALVVGIYSCRNKTVIQIPVADFFKAQIKTNYHISPDGKYVSYLTRDKDKQNVVITPLSGGKERVVNSSSSFFIRDYFWTYGNQIIITQVNPDSTLLLAVDATTFETHMLLKTSKVFFRVIARKTIDPNVITFQMNKRDTSVFDVYRINTKTGDLKMYVKNPGNITEWFPDADGNIRLAKASDGVNESILYRESDAANFAPIIVNNFKNTVEPIAFTSDKYHFYALSNVNRDKIALVEINVTNVKEVKVAYSTDSADIEEVGYSKNRHQLEMVTWQEAKPKHHFFNLRIKGIYDDLSGELPNNELKIVDRDSAEHNFVINAYNDRNPGIYYLYSTLTKKATKLNDLNGTIDSGALCQMKPVSFKAGDGTLINGYLTLPINVNPENLPLVVMPHTDPWRRNNWGWNADVQFLANRGYAVFQVNYRGSTGYGKAFYSAGFKQLGGKMQQDITDGVNWLIEQKIASAKKIAIFGTQFGGFSALYGASFHQGLYNCVVSQNGFINLFSYVKDVPPIFKSMLAMRYEMVGNPEADAEMFNEISPVFHADKIKCPVLIFQNGRDPHTNLNELTQYVTELRKRGAAVSYYAEEQRVRGQKRVPGEKDRARFLMYNELEKFLAANLQDKK